MTLTLSKEEIEELLKLIDVEFKRVVSPLKGWPERMVVLYIAHDKLTKALKESEG